MKSNLSRLEHELQTVVDGSFLSRRDWSLSAQGCGGALRWHIAATGARRAVSPGCPAP
jgi:hypothetical protein